MTEPQFSTIIVKEEPHDAMHDSVVIKEEIKVEIDPYDLGQESDDANEMVEPPSDAELQSYYYQPQFYSQSFTMTPEQAAATPQRNKRKSVPRKVMRQPETPSVPEHIVTGDKVTVTTTEVKNAEVKRLKPYGCELCDKSYTSKQQLKIHFRSHTGERPYVCNICQKDFKDRWKLTLHVQTHTGLKPFECDKCDKKYTTKYQLTTHYRIHTKDKLFICEVCTRQFVEKNKLEKHKNIHLGIKPYCCDLCDKRYRQKSHLKFHIENVHMAPPSDKAKNNKC